MRRRMRIGREEINLYRKMALQVEYHALATYDMSWKVMVVSICGGVTW
jgi:hypothetical protein